MLVKSFISTLLLVKASTAAAVGSATADLAVDPFAAYGVEELEWEFPTPDSGSVVVKGTIEQALTQLSENHPEVVPFTSATSNDVASLAKRSDFHNARFNCDWGQYGNVYRIGIEKGIEYLRNLNGRPRNGPGPGNCGRDRSTKTLEGFNSIADGAQYILMKCAYGGKGKAYVHGQVFHKTNWNVIVRHNKC